MIERMREDDHFILLDIGVDIAEDVERELLEPLRSLGFQAEIPPQGGGLPLEQLSAYIQVVGTSLSALASALVIADKFIAWRHKRQARPQPEPEPRQTTTSVIIRRPGREPLDLTDATDEEIRAYIIEQRGLELSINYKSITYKMIMLGYPLPDLNLVTGKPRERKTGIGRLVDELREFWSVNFALPGHGVTPYGWRAFAFVWLWTVAGVVPGALAAAYVLGRWQITDQLEQNVISVGLSLLSMVIIETALAVIYVLLGTVNKRTDSFDSWQTLFFKLSIGLPLALVWFAVPFLTAGGAVYWYFTHPSVAGNVAATGASGALVIKVFGTLFGIFVWPAIVGATKNILSRLIQRDDTTPRGA